MNKWVPGKYRCGNLFCEVRPCGNGLKMYTEYIEPGRASTNFFVTFPRSNIWEPIDRFPWEGVDSVERTEDE